MPQEPCALLFSGIDAPWHERAVELAQRLPDYQTLVVQDGIDHVVPVRPGSMVAIQPLLFLVMHDPGTRLLLDGVEVGRERFSDLLRLIACRRDSLMNDDPERCWCATGSYRGVVPCRLMNRTLGFSLACGAVDATQLDTALAEHESSALVALCTAAVEAIEAISPAVR